MIRPLIWESAVGAADVDDFWGNARNVPPNKAEVQGGGTHVWGIRPTRQPL